MAVTAQQAVITHINVATGNPEWLQLSGSTRTWQTNPALATLFASLQTARDIADDMRASSGSSDEWAVAVPALSLNNWVTR